MLSNTLLAISLLPVALAHFKLIYPAPRGFDEDKEPTFPCGGFNDVQQQRTDFSMSGSNLQLNMGHEQSNTAVYMAVGNNPGSAFNTVLRQQFTISGIGDFCIGGVSVPAGMNISDGTPATIQVVTNGDGKGGLYQVS
jgi:nascent polypeptide-associated complex subunit beta